MILQGKHPRGRAGHDLVLNLRHDLKLVTQGKIDFFVRNPFLGDLMQNVTVPYRLAFVRRVNVQIGRF